MADETGIINGSVDGLPISITSSSVDGGPKLSIKQFPNKDTQNIENLGLKPRSYSVDIDISAKRTREVQAGTGDRGRQDYFSYRNSLLAILESKKKIVLIHPLYGRLENMVAGPYSLSEILSRFGDATLSVTFDPDNNTGIPQSAGNVVTNVQAKNVAIRDAVQTDISDNYKVTNSNTGNFQAAVAKVDAIIDKASESTEFIGEAAKTLNEFSAEIGRLSGAVNSLVSDPLQLAIETVGLFESVNGLYESSEATFQTFIGFFGFGEDDAANKQNTAGLIERQSNNDILNGAVAASSLGYAYLSATQIEFETTRDIDEIAAQLDAQYDSVLASGSDQAVKDAATDMRVTVLDVFDQARVNARQILEVETLPTTTRLLAFSYYGNDDLGEAITDLNEITDVSFVEGTVEILTA